MKPSKTVALKRCGSLAALVALSLSLLLFPASPVKAVEPDVGKWVLTETQVNPANAPTEFYGGGKTPDWFGEPRFEGKHLLYSVSRNSFGIDSREVDHGHEYHNASVDVSFDEPPAELTPGETLELTASFSHGGTAEDGGVGALFWYSSDDVYMEPQNAFGYSPWNQNFDGTSTVTYSFDVPQAWYEDEEFSIHASLWNNAPCHVVWTFGAEPAGASEAPPKEEEKKVEEPEEDERRKPVIILPGIYGSYLASRGDQEEWVYNRGLHPTLLAIDPLAHSYDDLAATLQNAGYVLGEDLFLGAYDWRMPPGPIDDAYDGVITGISGASITDDLYEYGVDYLGYYLAQAAEQWRQKHDGEVLDSVDIISHSTGGLVARTYIQSIAHGGHYRASDGEAVPLPRVNNLVMVAVPNRGAALPWQAMNNNFIRDPASKYVMSRLLANSYSKLKWGYTIQHPTAPITPDSIRDPATGELDPVRFINSYCPTFRALLATYPFLIDLNGNLANINDRPGISNELALDLNNGLDLPDRPAPADPSPFSDAVNRTAVFFASEELTVHQVRERNTAALDAVFPLDAVFEQDVAAGTIWYQDIAGLVGDGTVPSLSAAGQFEGDGRIESHHVTSGDLSHTGLMANVSVQVGILDFLGVDRGEVQVMTGLAGTGWRNVLSAMSDPVGLLVVDGQGRRLGWTPETGILTEIPNSTWYGHGDGLGFVSGEVPQPLTVEMTGLDGDYVVQVAGEQGSQQVGFEESGTLASGEKRSAGLETRELGSKPAPVDTESTESAGTDGQLLLYAAIAVYALVVIVLVLIIVVLLRRRRA